MNISNAHYGLGFLFFLFTTTANASPDPLAWESPAHPERAAWSQEALKAVTHEFTVLNTATDMTTFCPTYANLTDEQKINAWANLFAGISFYESAWDPTSRMQESTFSEPDKVTHLPVYSEGLLQLSYDDILWAPYCKFDWNVDQNLSPTDPNKTILDPAKNLDCGIQIMGDQIARTGQVVLKTGVYWSTLREGGKYQKIQQIASLVQRLSFCQ